MASVSPAPNASPNQQSKACGWSRASIGGDYQPGARWRHARLTPLWLTATSSRMAPPHNVLLVTDSRHQHSSAGDAVLSDTLRNAGIGVTLTEEPAAVMQLGG